uniref:Uncharacterized protein n=1 Tax=Glossina pallidipes TaxID=7398 RepID=A0A1A9ZZZ4_GLOPL
MLPDVKYLQVIAFFSISLKKFKCRNEEVGIFGNNGSEEIPLEDFQQSPPHSRVPSGSGSSRSHTPSRALTFDQVSMSNNSASDSVHIPNVAQVNGGVTAAAKTKDSTTQINNSSEETSFIGSDQVDGLLSSGSNGRRRGVIETV